MSRVVLSYYFVPFLDIENKKSQVTIFEGPQGQRPRWMLKKKQTKQPQASQVHWVCATAPRSHRLRPLFASAFTCIGVFFGSPYGGGVAVVAGA